jgi:hypothetical protein
MGIASYFHLHNGQPVPVDLTFPKSLYKCLECGALVTQPNQHAAAHDERRTWHEKAAQ